MIENYMQNFLKDRKDVPSIKKYVAYSKGDAKERPHLLIGHPAILATFIGYLKFQAHKDKRKEIFFRGQTKDHLKIIPSLLRGDDFSKINRLSAAYEDLK